MGGNIWLLPTDGNVGFGDPIMAQAGSNPVALAVGDFNGDGKLDLAVAVTGTNTIALLRGDGAGKFQTPLLYLAGTAPVHWP